MRTSSDMGRVEDHRKDARHRPWHLRNHRWASVSPAVTLLEVLRGAYPVAIPLGTRGAREIEHAVRPAWPAFRQSAWPRGVGGIGLLVYEARRGWKIYRLSLDDIHEIFDIKEILEGLVARQAAKCEDKTLHAALREALKTMQEAAELGDSEAWLHADHRLHDVIFQMAGNKRAWQIVANLNDQWHRVRIGFMALQGRTLRSAEEHRLFVESVLAGDGEEAELRMRAHLNEVREELVHLLVTVVLPFVEEGV